MNENSRAKSNAYKRQFDKEHYEKLLLSFPKGSKDMIKDKAQKAGKSMSQYVLDLVKQDTRF